MVRELKKIKIWFLKDELYNIFRQLESMFTNNECSVERVNADQDDMQEQLKQEEKVLWITDDITFANTLCRNGLPILFYLNNNTSQNLEHITYCIEGFEDVDFAYFDQVYCRCKGIPWTVLETERLLVREQTVADVDTLYELYADPSITKYMENLYTKREQEYEYTRDYIRNVYGFYGYGIWIVIEKASGNIIGRAGVESKEGFAGLEIGFMIGVPYQHKGYATEVCQAIIQHGREELEIQEYRALVMKDNIMSIKLLTKLGFHYTGEIEDNQVLYDVYIS